MNTNYDTSTDESGVLAKRKINPGLSLKHNTLVRVEFDELLRDEPDIDSAFLIRLKSGNEQWMPYSKCYYEGTTLFIPLWLYRKRLQEGRI